MWYYAVSKEPVIYSREQSVQRNGSPGKHEGQVSWTDSAALKTPKLWAAINLT